MKILDWIDKISKIATAITAVATAIGVLVGAVSGRPVLLWVSFALALAVIIGASVIVFVWWMRRRRVKPRPVRRVIVAGDGHHWPMFAPESRPVDPVAPNRPVWRPERPPAGRRIPPTETAVNRPTGTTRMTFPREGPTQRF